MMRIIGRFTLNEMNGYMLDDDGSEYSVVERGLYSSGILESLVESGYKVLNYHGDILTPEGINIKDILETPCTATEDEIQMMLDEASEGVLSEAEATEFFSRDVVMNEMKFKEPKVTIKTREELVDYLYKYKQLSKYSNSIQDVRPLNSFVAKEALFTCAELAANEEIRDLFHIIESRRKLPNYGTYRELIKFLQSEKVLGENYTAEDVREAYMAWGICGIKTPVINKYSKVGDISDIFHKPNNHIITDFTGRYKEICLIDKNGVVYYSGGKIDLSDVDEFEKETVMPETESAYYNAIRSVSEWETDYYAINCLVRRARTCTYYEMLDENGISYTMRMDNTRMVLCDVRNVFYASSFLFVKMLNDIYIPIDKVQTQEDYALYNMVCTKARDIVRAKTVKVPVKSSYELIVKEGVSPEAAVRYIARRVYENKEREELTDISFIDAFQYYRKGPDQRLIEKYNPQGYDYENLDELIDIMCATRDEMENEGKYLVISKDDRSLDASLIRDEVTQRPVEQLEFVKEVKRGNITVDYMGEGRKIDGSAEIESIANLIELMVRIEQNGNVSNLTGVAQCIRNIEDSKIINLNNIVKQRDAEYKGYLKDRAYLNSARARQATELVYITKVFREISNRPIEEQRHYAFECVHFSIGKNNKREIAMQMEISNAVKEAITQVDTLTPEMKEIITLEADSISAKLLFKIMFKQVKTIEEDNKLVIAIKEKIMISKTISTDIIIKISANTFTMLQNDTYKQVRYCTLYDWCDNEVSSNTAFNLYCVNANIDPWRVMPKDGFTIPSYNFMVNYYAPATIEKAFPPQLIEKIENERAKVTSISKRYTDYSLLQSGFIDDLIEYTFDDIGTVLNYMNEETIGNYYKRWTLWNKHIRQENNNRTLIEIPLKSDIVFKNYATDEQRIVLQEVVEEIEDKRIGSYNLTQVTPVVLTSKVTAIEQIQTGNMIKEFNFTEKSFENVIRWTDLITGNFRQNGLCIYLAGQLNVVTANNKTIFDLKTMSKANAEKLADENIFYQLDATHFLIQAINGNYELEVD